MAVSRETMTDLKRKLRSKKNADLYNACVEIRKNVIKIPQGVSRLVREHVIPILLNILKRTSTEQSTEGGIEEPFRSKVKDVICSILGNVCMDIAAREEVLKHDGINILGDILCTTEVESLQNRCCRCMANMCLSPSAWKLVHNTEVIEKIVKLLKESENSDCQQTYIRAVRLLGQTGPCVQKLLDNNAVSVVMKYVDSEHHQVARSALTCITFLSAHRNTIQFASQVVSSGKLSHLISIAKATELETSHDALSVLIGLSEHHNFRPAFGNAGGISLFTSLLEIDNFTVKEKLISVLCLCCKEAVNRVKLRDEGVLKLFIEFLKDNLYKALHLRIVSALVCFLYDEASFDTLLECGLVPVLISHLRCYLDEDSVPCIVSHGAGCKAGDLMEVNVSHGAGCKAGDLMEVNVSHGAGCKAGDFMEVNVSHGAGCSSDKAGDSNLGRTACEEPVKEKLGASGSKHHKRRNENEIVNKGETMEVDTYEHGGQLVIDKMSDEIVEPGEVDESELLKVESPSQNKPEEETSVEMKDVEKLMIEQGIGSHDPLSLSVPCDDNKPALSKDIKHYSMDSPSYEVQSESLTDYSSGVKCKMSFSPHHTIESTCEVYSPISNVSYYSPAASSSEYSPQSDRIASPISVSRSPVYSGLGSPAYECVPSPESNPTCRKLDLDVGTSNTEREGHEHEEWLWSPGESQNSDSDSDGESNNMDNNLNEMKSALSTVASKLDILEKKNNDMKFLEKEQNFVDTRCVKGEEMNAENSVSEEQKTQKTYKKRKKSDNAMENSILILLSRVSQMTNPTVHFVSTETISCLLDYIIEMEAPLARTARLLSRVFRNPHCFQRLLMLKIPVLIYEKLLRYENVPAVLKRISLLKRGEKRLSSGYRSRSDSISSDSTESDRFSLFDKRSDDEGFPAKRQRLNDSAEWIKREVKGIYYKQEEEVCDAGKSGISFLEDLSGVAESPYGRGVIEKLVKQDEQSRENVYLSVLFLCRNQAAIDFFNKLEIFNSIFIMLEQRQSYNLKVIVQGLSLLAHLLKFKTRFQSSCDDTSLNVSMEKTASYISSLSKISLIQKMDGSLSEKSEDDRIGNTSEKFMYESPAIKHKCTFRGLTHITASCFISSCHTCLNKDVTFVVKNEKLTGNRNKLIKSSEIFAAMLEGHYTESSLSEIKLSETSKFAFKYILHYLHGCKAQGCDIVNYFSNCEVSRKSSRRLVKVLKEADKYLLYDLKSELTNLLFDKFVISMTALDFFEYAVMYDNIKIQRATVSCLLVDSASTDQLLFWFQKFLSSKFAGVFMNTLTELMLD